MYDLSFDAKLSIRLVLKVLGVVDMEPGELAVFS
jgi:hypothetical protein